MRLLATWARIRPAKARTSRPGRNPGRCTASRVATAPATRVMGRTAARVRTSQRDTGSRGRPDGGLVVRRTSRHAAVRLWTGGVWTGGGRTSLTSFIVRRDPSTIEWRPQKGPERACGRNSDMTDPVDHDHVIDTGKGTFDLSQLGRLLPGMAEIMPLVGDRIWKCYYAGKAQNQPLARFQLKEAKGLMEKGAILRPKYTEDMDK